MSRPEADGRIRPIYGTLNSQRMPAYHRLDLRVDQRDVLEKAKVQWVLLLQGVNDIAGSTVFSDTTQKVTADQIIAGMKTLIAKAHEHKLKIIGATILPRGGATGRLASTPQSEAMRQQVNAWIRGHNQFDAIVDFDLVVRDPSHPERQLPAYNSGDFRHPNAAGYRAMAEAIDLKISNKAVKVEDMALKFPLLKIILHL